MRITDGFESQTLRDTIQPRDLGPNTWMKLRKKQQSKDSEVCPIRNGVFICEWSIKYRALGPISCQGRSYRDRCSVYKRVMDAGGDPSVLIQ